MPHIALDIGAQLLPPPASANCEAWLPQLPLLHSPACLQLLLLLLRLLLLLLLRNGGCCS